MNKIFIDTNFFVYLNVQEPEQRKLYNDFYSKLLEKYDLYTDVLVLDELIFVSKKKYSVPYNASIDLIENDILPYVTILGITKNEYEKTKELILKYNLKPSDALHVAAMLNNGITLILSEDHDFDRVIEIKRKWINDHI